MPLFEPYDISANDGLSSLSLWTQDKWKGKRDQGRSPCFKGKEHGDDSVTLTSSTEISNKEFLKNRAILHGKDCKCSEIVTSRWNVK